MSPDAEGSLIRKLTGRARNPIILTAFGDYLLVGRSFSPYTLESYSSQIRRFENFLSGKKSLLQAKRKDAKAFLEYRRSCGIGERSLAQLVSALRHFYKFLVSRGYSRRSPMSRIGSPTQWKGLPRTVAKDEIDLIVNSKKPVDTSTVEQAIAGRDRAIIEVLYLGALRVSELIALKVEDVNVRAARGFVFVKGKGRRNRICMLGHDAVSALRNYLAESRHLLETTNSGTALFLGIGGRALTRQRVWQVVATASARTGRRMGPNTLRQSRAAHMVENGADLSALQRFLGYSDIKNTKVHALGAVMNRENEQPPDPKHTMDFLRRQYRDHHPRGRSKP